MDIFSIFFQAIINGLVTAIIIHYVIIRAGKRILDQVRDSIGDSENAYLDSDILDAYIDFEGNTMILYAKEDNAFIAQGSTWEELNMNAMNRFPGQMFNITQSEIEKAKEFKK